MQHLMNKIYVTLFRWTGSSYSDYASNLKYVRSSDIVNEKILKIAKDGSKVEAAQVDINFLYSGGSYSSAFAYYYYPSDATITADYIKGLKKFIVFPRFKRGRPSKKLKVRLQYFGKDYNESGVDKFPPGVTIGWEIIPKLLNSSNGVLNNNANTDEVQNAIISAYKADRCIYSNTIANTIITKGDEEYVGKPGPGCIALYDQASNRKVIGFEDLVFDRDFTSGQKTNFTDILFYVTSNPLTANNDLVQRLESDEDILATQTTYGTYAFEDIWPKGGDYDLNDVVVEHWRGLTYNQNNVIKEIKDVFIPKHNGAKQDNAFGVIFDNDNLGSIDYSQSPGIIKEAENQFILFKIDESETDESFKDKSYVIVRKFTDANYRLENYENKLNPFVVPRYNENTSSSTVFRNEIHLPLKEASSWVDKNFKNSKDDAWYVHKDGKYPFAIELSNMKDWKWNKNEGSHIDSIAYPQFRDWADSKGSKNQGWFWHYGKE